MALYIKHRDKGVNRHLPLNQALRDKYKSLREFIAWFKIFHKNRNIGRDIYHYINYFKYIYDTDINNSVKIEKINKTEYKYIITTSNNVYVFEKQEIKNIYIYNECLFYYNKNINGFSLLTSRYPMKKMISDGYLVERKD